MSKVINIINGHKVVEYYVRNILKTVTIDDEYIIDVTIGMDSYGNYDKDCDYVEIYLSNGGIDNLCKKFNTYNGDICSVFDSVNGILSYL